METDDFRNRAPTADLQQTDGLHTWITAFLRSCRSRNLSGGTIEFYGKKLKAFAGFCLENNAEKISAISADLIRHSLMRLTEDGHLPAGVHCYYRAVKTFLRWYERETEPENWRNPINKV